MSDEDPKVPEGAAEDAAAKAAAAAAAKAEAAEKARLAAEARAAAEAAKAPWERDAVSPSWEDAGEDPLAQAIQGAFGAALLAARSCAGDLTLELAPESVAAVGRALKEEHGFTYLIDVCGADYPEREKRFDVLYHLHSFAANRRIRLRVQVDEATAVPTVSGVWRAANWSEREAYDMYGIRFADHPDLTRILLWEGFNGYPLRKDFPVEGIDTGSAIYPEYYAEEAGPIAGTGTGWKSPKPAEPEAEPGPEAGGQAADGAAEGGAP